MEIEIIENKKQNLYVYKNDDLSFYSTIHVNWTNRNIKIYNQDDNLLLNVKVQTLLFKTTYKILFQSELMNKAVSNITDYHIFFDQNKNLKLSLNNFSFNPNFSYFLGETKIAYVKQKIWSSLQKITLYIDDENLEFLDQIIIHLLVKKTGFNLN